ncbi:hypothetical protein SEUCBS140593_010726 [Sporothrix eucalyptigena]|uniref:Aspartate aminotransferase family protein n=1 Tax=Sporothrix eucalyptigena TaxID=1812306 RepID=A0ABP0D5T2_9PEZI
MQSSVFHRSIGKAYPTAARGDGVYLITEDGKRIFDGSSGAAVSCLGHGNTEIIEAICEQARGMAFAHSSFFTNDPAESLSRLLIENTRKTTPDAGGFPAKVLFLSSGSEAVESSLKLARQYHVYRGEPQRVNIIGRTHAYHGNTLGALAAGNNPARCDTYAPLLAPTFHHVRRCFYQADGQAQGITEDEYEDALLDDWEATFNRLGPQTVAAVIVEPVGGATLGAVPATKTYLPRLAALCRRHGALVIFDEVMCGMGRCGTYHAWQALGGVAPDLQSIGKGLSGGYQPLSAVLVGSKVFEKFEAAHKDGAAPFVSGHTFQDHAIACAAALQAQTILLRDDLVSRCHSMGKLLHATLTAELPPCFAEHGGLQRGLGLFRAVDFGGLGAAVGGGPLAKAVADAALDLGAVVYLCSPVVDSIMLCPPFTMTENQTVALARIVVKAVNTVSKARQPKG